MYVNPVVCVVQSSEKASRSTLKLTKKEGRAFLTIDSTQDGANIIQDVPITIQSFRSIAEHDEPVLDTPTMKFRLPNIRVLHQMCDTIKQLDHTGQLTITADDNGRVKFIIQDQQVR